MREDEEMMENVGCVLLAVLQDDERTFCKHGLRGALQGSAVLLLSELSRVEIRHVVTIAIKCCRNVNIEDPSTFICKVSRILRASFSRLPCPSNLDLSSTTMITTL
jgi:hypothetical protein